MVGRFIASCRFFQVLTDGKHTPGKEHFGNLHSVSLFPINNSSSHPLLCVSESGLKFFITITSDCLKGMSQNV